MAATSSASRPPQRERRQPQRSCVACRVPGTKRELIRLVREADGGVALDPTGRADGRGAYVGPFRACWSEALTGKRLSQALRTNLSEHDRAALRAFAESLPAGPCPNQEKETS